MLRIVSIYLKFKLSFYYSQKKIKQAFAKLPELSLTDRDTVYDSCNDSGNDSSCVSGIVRVCALQAEAKIYKNLENLVRDIDKYFVDAEEKKADIVCFPELYGLMLLGVLPEVRFALSLMVKKTDSSSASPVGEFDLTQFSGLLKDLTEYYISIMAFFARRYKVYLSCGTIFTAGDDDNIYNRHILLGPDGDLLAAADKMHLTTDEYLLNVSKGNKVVVVPTGIGNIALTVCMDATYFEPYRIAKNLGADWAIVPVACMEECDPWLALRGVQTRSIETNLTMIKPALVSGEDFPVLFTGRAGIWFPYDSGFKSVETDSWSGASSVIADIDIMALRKSKNEYFGRVNPEFDLNYIKEVVS